jgi:hypothetical protein
LTLPSNKPESEESPPNPEGAVVVVVELDVEVVVEDDVVVLPPTLTVPSING